MKNYVLILLFTLTALLGKAQTMTSQSGDAIIGVWQTDDHKARININRQDSVYYGRLSNAEVSIWQKAKLNLPTGFLGINILRNFKFSGDNRWDGTIYDPKSKNTYQCYLKMNDDGTLKVRGYKGISIFGKSQVWTRVK
ncbi:DUF2147 domain-containing protein [Mucilaginibacter sp. CSA2-8R]|uniref:DUF2147 domain-containing protein n=1 Tax=Mucilaginibacter sp. CSA2-8R TaxID=3141542 RepID=UPI00315DA79D